MDENLNHPKWERTFIGGMRWGYSRWQSRRVTFPLASLTLRPGALELRAHLWVLSSHYSFTPLDVSAVHLERGLLFRGVQIVQTKHRYTPYICFLAFETRPVVELAAAAGFRVEG